VIGSPLYARGLEVGGRRSDVLYAVTEGGSVYALRRTTGNVIWQRQLGIVTACGGQFGITSTPVIDRSAETLYVIGASGALHALDLATGAEREGWPIPLLAYPDAEHVWRGLTLAGGRVYVPVASYCDEQTAEGTYADGRLIAVDASQHRVSRRSMSFLELATSAGSGATEEPPSIPTTDRFGRQPVTPGSSTPLADASTRAPASRNRSSG
jgi:glucose dehydrogenase